MTAMKKSTLPKNGNIVDVIVVERAQSSNWFWWLFACLSSAITSLKNNRIADETHWIISLLKCCVFLYFCFVYIFLMYGKKRLSRFSSKISNDSRLYTLWYCRSVYTMHGTNNAPIQPTKIAMNYSSELFSVKQREEKAQTSSRTQLKQIQCKFSRHGILMKFACVTILPNYSQNKSLYGV